jgi:hypothetical protein
VDSTLLCIQYQVSHSPHLKFRDRRFLNYLVADCRSCSCWCLGYSWLDLVCHHLMDLGIVCWTSIPSWNKIALPKPSFLDQHSNIYKTWMLLQGLIWCKTGSRPLTKEMKCPMTFMAVMRHGNKNHSTWKWVLNP